MTQRRDGIYLFTLFSSLVIIFLIFYSKKYDGRRITPDSSQLLAGNELFERYAQKYEEAKDPNKAHTFKYLVWHYHRAGWGNVLSDHASGITFALITGRLIYINSEKYDPPLTTKIPAWLNWPAQRSILEQTAEGKACVQSQRMINHNTKLYTSWLVEDHRLEPECVIITGARGDYMTPALAANPHYKEFFDNYTTNHDAFNFIANQMWKPSQAAQVEIDKILPDLLQYEYKIGIHTRRLKWRTIVNNFPYQEFCDLANGLAATSGLRENQIVIFAGADDPKEALPFIEKCVYPYKFIHSPISTNRSIAGNPGSDLSAIIDLFLLSRCDEIISTIGSSFSEVAAGIGKITPWHILPGNHSNTYNPAYYKQLNSEPCMYNARRWRRQEGDNMKLFMKNGMWRQYEQCHPDPDTHPRLR